MSDPNAADNDFFGLLVHELRNPLGAITGYQELLAEGLYGELDKRGIDALERIRVSADQLLSLLDGLSELSRPGSSLLPDRSITDLNTVLLHAVDNARILAAARGATVTADALPGAPPIVTDSERLARTLDLAFGAAVRASPGTELNVKFSVIDSSSHEILLYGSALDPVRDDPSLPMVPPGAGQPAVATGPGLRLAMARSLAQSIGSDVDLRSEAGSTILRIRIAALDNT